MEDKQYYWTDLESGVRYPCTKGHYDSMKKLWRDAMPKFVPSPKMTKLVFGTHTGENNWIKDVFISGVDFAKGESKSSIYFIPLKAEWKEKPDPSIFQKIFSAVCVPAKYFKK
jgi:hypothetical protein